MRKFGNTFARTIPLEPHILLPPYQVDGEQLTRRQVNLLGSWLKLKFGIKVVRLTKQRYKLYCNGVTILIYQQFEDTNYVLFKKKKKLVR